MYIVSKILIFILLMSFSLILEPILVLAQVFQPPPPPIIMIVPGASSPGTPNPFNPPSVNLQLGAYGGSVTIRWLNTDTVIHTVTSSTNNFDSPIIGPNQPFEYTFYNTGYYNYYCRIHPFMTGLITIS